MLDQYDQYQLESALRTQWDHLAPRILGEFITLSTADITAARSVDDLVSRIADKSHYSERFVELRLVQLAGVPSQVNQGQQGEQNRSDQPMSAGVPRGQQHNRGEAQEPFGAPRPQTGQLQDS